MPCSEGKKKAPPFRWLPAVVFAVQPVQVVQEQADRDGEERDQRISEIPELGEGFLQRLGLPQKITERRPDQSEQEKQYDNVQRFFVLIFHDYRLCLFDTANIINILLLCKT